MPAAVKALTRYDFVCYVLQAASHVMWVAQNVRYSLNNRQVGHVVAAMKASQHP